MKKRLLSLLLCVLVLLYGIPIQALAETEAHTHNADGWQCTSESRQGTLECELEEHTHEDDEKSLACGSLEEDHEHTQACYEQVCEKTVHTHSEDCFKVVATEWNCVPPETTDDEDSAREQNHGDNDESRNADEAGVACKEQPLTEILAENTAFVTLNDNQGRILATNDPSRNLDAYYKEGCTIDIGAAVAGWPADL